MTGDDDGSVLRALLESWATDRETVFDVRVQLRTNADTMPVEDAAVDWPVVMATVVLAMLPPVLVVVLMQRAFVKGLVETEK